MTVDPTPHLRRVGLIITIASLTAIAIATLLPESTAPVGSHFCLICGSVGTVDAILNIILFVPLGIGLALSGVPAKRAVIGVFALSVLVETAQFLAISGRDSTVGDVLTNTIGGTLGFAISRYRSLLLRPPSRTARTLVLGWATLWLTIQLISNYGFAVSLPHSKYYGQIARTLGNFAVFPGTVLSPRIDGVPIPNTALDASVTVERLLLDGATVATTVVPGKPTRKIAPIVRVADVRQREILLLAQDGDRFIFAVRTGAAALRVRRPLFALAKVFPIGPSGDSSAVDTLTLTGRYAASDVRIHAYGRSKTTDRLIPITASLGWTLWLPFQWLIEGTRAERVVSIVWIGCLLIPLGYWASRVRHPSSAKHGFSERAIVLLSNIALLIAGLTLIPHILGLGAAPFGDWVATFGGFFIGYGLGARMARYGVSAASTDREHKG